MLPGAGSDEVFIRSVFAGALAGAGVELVAPPPRGGADVVAGYRAALNAAPGPLVVGGISLGAHVAARSAAVAPRGRVAGCSSRCPRGRGRRAALRPRWRRAGRPSGRAAAGS